MPGYNSTGVFINMYSLDFVHVVGRQHSSASRASDRANHPAFINRLYVNNQVAVMETNLIIILGVVVKHSLEHRALETKATQAFCIVNINDL